MQHFVLSYVSQRWHAGLFSLLCPSSCRTLFSLMSPSGGMQDFVLSYVSQRWHAGLFSLLCPSSCRTLFPLMSPSGGMQDFFLSYALRHAGLCRTLFSLLSPSGGMQVFRVCFFIFSNRLPKKDFCLKRTKGFVFETLYVCFLRSAVLFQRSQGGFCSLAMSSQISSFLSVDNKKETISWFAAIHTHITQLLKSNSYSMVDLSKLFQNCAVKTKQWKWSMEKSSKYLDSLM